MNHQQQQCDLINHSQSSSNLSSSSTPSCSSSSSSSKKHKQILNQLMCKAEENVKLEDKSHDTMEIEIEEQQQLQKQMRQQWIQQYEVKMSNIQKRRGPLNIDNISATVGGIQDYELYYDEDENDIMNEEEIKKMHYGAVKIKNDESQAEESKDKDQQEQNQSKIISNDEMLLQHFVMKKAIVKMKKNSSKKFTKKILSIQPIFFKEITSHNKFMIFGFQQVEQFYRDFDDQNDSNLILQCRYVVDVNRIVTNLAENLVEVYFNVKGRSGLTDFRFIIDHFSKQPEQYYHDLADLLKEYQHLVSISVSHMSKINRMIRFQMLTEDEIALAFAQSEHYFNNYIKHKYRTNPTSNCNHSNYLMYTTVRSNYHTLDLDVYSNIFTKQMFDLLGLDQSALEILSAINTPFQMPQGDTRLKDITNLIRIYVSQKSFQNLPITFYTQDGIQVTTSLDCEIINYPHSPEWMIPLDTFVILIKFNLNEKELSQVYSYRAPPKSIEYIPLSNQSEKKKQKILSSNSIQQKELQEIKDGGDNEFAAVLASSFNQDSQYSTEKFEYTMQSELFLEKFYPNYSSEGLISFQQSPPSSNTQIKNKKEKKNSKQMK